MMWNDWTIKWQMKLNADASKAKQLYAEKNNSNFAYT